LNNQKSKNESEKKIENNNYNRRSKRKKPEKGYKDAYDRQRTQQEVQKIQKNLVDFAKTSWGKKWIQSILKTGRPFRMQRGIDYAKDEERIGNLQINPGEIFSTVQGTAPTPYRVRINFEKIPEDGWKKILSSLTNKIINLIRLLEGDLPEDIIKIFTEHKYPLFPDSIKSSNAKCSCPDQAIPCKHIAAVILYLALALDYDPFILMKLRGKSKSEILSDLRLLQVIDKEITEEKVQKIQKIQDKTEFSFNLPKISIAELYKKKSTSDDIHKIGFKFKKPGKIIETLENLGMPSNLNNPKAFETVFRAIYRTVSTDIYKKSMEMEKN